MSDHNRFASNINWKARYDQRIILNVEWMNFNLNLPEIPPDLGFPVWIEDDVSQGYNARKVNCSCVHIETSSLWTEFVNKNRCISVRLISEKIKAFNFDNFDNSHISFR